MLMRETEHELTTSLARRAQLGGSLVALVTPMRVDGSIDWDVQRALIEWHIGEGTDGLVIMGSTGESATVSMDEHCTLIREAVECAKGRIPVVAGTGANSTTEAIDLAQYAKSAGADAHLSVVPYYNKPTQEGLYQHFCAVAEVVDLPLILYNVPGRTITDMSRETVFRLAQVPGIVGLKDATGDIARGATLLRDLPNDFLLFSGDDATAGALMLMGAVGNISVTANVVPRLMHELCEAARAGDVARVARISTQLAALNEALFLESNPIPVKWALAKMQRISPAYRLPLTELSEQYQPEVERSLRLAGVTLP